jgi:hypothetical protein
MHPVLTRIATEKPDAIYLPIFVAAAAQLMRQAPTIPGLEKTPLIGGGALILSAELREQWLAFEIILTHPPDSRRSPRPEDIPVP